MTTRTMLSPLVLFALLAVTYGWLDLTDTKNCFCKAVDNSNYGRVFHDFGSIQRCHQFGHCFCDHSALINCGTACDRKVKEWVCEQNCGGNRNGMKVRADFQASVCNSGRAPDIYTCGSQDNCARG